MNSTQSGIASAIEMIFFRSLESMKTLLLHVTTVAKEKRKQDEPYKNTQKFNKNNFPENTKQPNNL